jgi:hypothetical protein
MPGDPRTYGLAEQLYDMYAHRLHAYCRVLLGDAAGDAVAEVFATAERRGLPRDGDTQMWLYGLARTECERRGALNLRLTGSAGRSIADPLARAAAALRTEQREALLLSSGDWLEVPEIARLLGLAPDTVRDLIRTGRAKLERGVLDALLAGPARGAMTRAEHEELIGAFEKGTLPALYARRTGAVPPAALRTRVVGTTAEPAGELLHGVPITSRTAHMLGEEIPIVDATGASASADAATVISGSTWGGAEPEEEPPQLLVIDTDVPARSRRNRRMAGVVGLAACGAVAAGLVTAGTVSGTGIVATGRSLLSPIASDTGGRQAPATTDTTGATRLSPDARTASASASATAVPTTPAATPPGVLPSTASPSVITHPAHPVGPPTTSSPSASSTPSPTSPSPSASDSPTPTTSSSASPDVSDSPTPSVSP